MREMEVTGLALDPVSNAPIILLREKDGERVVPIWIGVVEASAIAFELEGVQLPRPMTHDLLKTSIQSLGARVEKVRVVDLRDNTYFAEVVLNSSNGEVIIDARPSDAIALALRTRSPVYCAQHVVEAAHVQAQKSESPAVSESQSETAEQAEPENEGPKPILDIGAQSPLEVLENLSPEDFGKYKM